MTKSTLLLLSATLAAAVPAARFHSLHACNNSATPSGKATILVGRPGEIHSFVLENNVFTDQANFTQDGVTSSWIVFKEPDLLFAVDENSANLLTFQFDPTSEKPEFKPLGPVVGTQGVVHLEFNADKTRMIGSSFGAGAVDIWDTSAPGSPTLVKNISFAGDPVGPNSVRQTQSRAHQANRDPTGRFFAINDLGTDIISIIDSRDDRFEVTFKALSEPGCGPRHGTWFPKPGSADKATHYIVVCEITNRIIVFKATYNVDSITLVNIQALSTFGAAFPPANVTAAAGELIVSADSNDVYVSNRLTGNETDSIAHFRVEKDEDCTDKDQILLVFADTISSGGLVPRMFSFDAAEGALLSTNQDGELGLAVFARGADGALASNPVTEKRNAEFFDPVAQPGFGPQFVMQIA